MRGMRELGYIEGKNLQVEFRWAEGKYERLSGLAAELVELKVDVIVAAGRSRYRRGKESDEHDSHRHGDFAGSGG